MKLHITTYITFDLVPITLFLYYAHLVIRKLLNKSSLFIPDLLIEEQDKHQRLLMKKWQVQNYLSIDIYETFSITSFLRNWKLWRHHYSFQTP